MGEFVWSLRGRRALIAIFGILLLALALRVVNIGWSYSNNGVDEGVMIERALMVSRGFSLYDDLPCDQAPTAFLVGSLFSGDVVSLRLLTAVTSVAAVAGCMLASNRMAGLYAMMITGALLAVDFTLVRESRLFSLDAMSASLMALSLVAFVISQRRGRLPWLAFSGVLIGLSVSVKLIGGIALLGMLLFIAMEGLAKRQSPKTSLVSGSVIALTSAVPMALLMLALGPSDMLEGMLFDQAHREFEAYLKLSVLAFFGLSAAYALPFVYGMRIWRIGPDTRLLLCVAVVLLLFMLFQPLTFVHHMVFLSPVMAILVGVLMASETGFVKGAFSERPERFEPNRARRGNVCKAALVASLLVSGSLSVYGIAAQGEPVQVKYGRLLAELTAEEDYVICGDPIIAAYADRRTPPDVVNAAERQYPVLDLDTLRRAVVEYEVRVVVVCYYLNEIPGLEGMLADEGFAPLPMPFGVAGGETEAVLDLFQEPIGPVTFYGRR